MSKYENKHQILDLAFKMARKHAELKNFFALCESDETLTQKLIETIESFEEDQTKNPGPPTPPYIRKYADRSCFHFIGGKETRPGGPKFVRFDFLPTPRKPLQVSSVMHFAYYKRRNPSTPYPSLEMKEYSHLCGKANCINPMHLRIEPHRINCERRRCHKNRTCKGHEGYDDCIISHSRQSERGKTLTK